MRSGRIAVCSLSTIWSTNGCRIRSWWPWRRFGGLPCGLYGPLWAAWVLKHFSLGAVGTRCTRFPLNCFGATYGTSDTLSAEDHQNPPPYEDSVPLPSLCYGPIRFGGLSPNWHRANSQQVFSRASKSISTSTLAETSNRAEPCVTGPFEGVRTFNPGVSKGVQTWRVSSVLCPRACLTSLLLPAGIRTIVRITSEKQQNPQPWETVEAVVVRKYGRCRGY